MMNGNDVTSFIDGFDQVFKTWRKLPPWKITGSLSTIIADLLVTLDAEYIIKNGIAIHKTAVVEDRAILKPPIIIGKGCFVGANAYLRNGVFLGEGSSLGPSCEVKTSIIFQHTEIAHLNFVGDSIIGSYCNLEAGSITANYFNERDDKTIYVLMDAEKIKTDVQKFGSLIGDRCKIGANAVLSPGTVLVPRSVVKRLELVEQSNEK